MLFLSLGQVPVALVPALLAVPALGMSMGILQEPIRHGECVKRNATVKLYPKTPTGYDRYNNPSSRDLQPATALSIPPNTCLSGDYPLSQNLEIVNVPICADGSSSTWSIFSNRGCTGRPRQGFHAVPMTSSSWPTTPYYWSLIFRCGASSSAQVTSDIEHLDAVPPAGPSKGVIQQGALNSCYSQASEIGAFNHRQVLAVDTCHKTRDFGLRIDEVATCKNGTRAQWARFSDDKCRSPVSEDPLMDINDGDIGKCQPLGDWVRSRPNRVSPNSWKVGSMSFHCDGVQGPEDDVPKAQPAIISTDSCQTSTAVPNDRPSFQYPEPDTCIEQQWRQFKIHENAICPNGTSAILTQYARGGCQGTPQCFTEIGDGILDQCLAGATFQSFSFMCTGNIQRPMVPQIRWRSGYGSENQVKKVLISGIVMLAAGCVLVLAMILRAIFRDEKRRAKVRCYFTRGRREGTIVLL